MITFDKSQNLIKLDNGSISYCIYINSFGYLETVYFGKHVKDFDIDFIRNGGTCEPDVIYYDTDKNQEACYEDGFKNGVAPLEICPHGRRDKRFAPVLVNRDNGSYTTDFRYLSHTIYKGTKKLEGLPSFHGENCETVEILLKERQREIYITQKLTIFSDKDIIVKNMEITNKTGKRVDLDRAYSMQLDLCRKDFDLVHFYGRWSRERNMEITPITDGAIEVASNLGATSHEENTFVYLKSNTATYDYGDVIGFNLLYSGNFKFRAESNFWKGLHIVYGINDEDFCWKLNDKETFVTPQVAISYSYSGIDKMSQNFHDFIRENIINFKHDKEYKSIIFNSWEGCYMTFNTESMLSYIDESVKVGAELFIIDDGWFGARDTDMAGLGDWYVNKNKIDLHKVIDYCNSKGLKFGIWFEPEMVNYNSDLYRKHPDYILKEDNEHIHVARHQFCLDFTNKEVVENIYKQMTAFLKEYKIDYIKWDYNRRVYEHFASHLGKDRQGEVYHRMVLGYYSLLSRIAQENPEILIEGCAGGGARFDLGTLCYTSQIWASDEQNPVRRCLNNFNTSLGYPFTVISTHANNCKLMNYKDKALFALFGTYGYEFDPTKITRKEKKDLFEVAKLYKKYHKNVIENGDVYHYQNPQFDNWYTVQCVSKDKSKSLLMLMNLLTDKDIFRYLKIRGLDPNKKYRNSLDNKVYYGDYYMNVGLNLSRECRGEFELKLIVFEQVRK